MNILKAIAALFYRENQKLVETIEDDVEDDSSVNDGFFTTSMKRRKPLDLNVVASMAFRREASQDLDSVAFDSASDEGGGIKERFSLSFANVPDIQLSWYASQGFIGYQACAIISQHWMITKACSMPGEDAIRNGYELSFGDGVVISDEIKNRIKRSDKKYKIKKNLEQFVKMGRLFGIRHALFLVKSDDEEYYEKPFNIDGVTRGSYQGICQIDPYWISPILSGTASSDPMSIGFYEPTYWRVNGKKIHKSHFVIMLNGEVPDVLKPTYMYGGIPLPQKIYERVYAAERCANESPQLLVTKRSTVVHANMDKATANPELFEQKLAEWVRYRDNYGVKAVGTEEVVEQFDTSLSDLDDTIMSQYQLVAAIAEVPSTKLLGTSPKGFNATGEYEESNYHEFLESMQSHYLTPLLDRHMAIIIRSELNRNDLSFEIVWNPTDSKTDKELAEVNEIKSRTGANLINSGAILPEHELERIISDRDSGYTNMSQSDIENDADRDNQDE